MYVVLGLEHQMIMVLDWDVRPPKMVGDLDLATEACRELNVLHPYHKYEVKKLV
jgi:hypothetical protein